MAGVTVTRDLLPCRMLAFIKVTVLVLVTDKRSLGTCSQTVLSASRMGSTLHSSGELTFQLIMTEVTGRAE